MKVKEDPIFAMVADSYKNTVLSMKRYSTIKTYNSVFIGLVEEFGHLKLSQITKDHIQQYVSKLNQNVSPRTVKEYYGLFKRVMEWADEDWVAPRRIALPRKRRIQQDFYTVAEMRTLIMAASGPFKVLLMLLSETGCRIGEALALQTRDLVGDTLKIDRCVVAGWVEDSPKTDSSIRTICISKELAFALKNICIHGEKSFIFRTTTGRPMWRQDVDIRLQKMCASLGMGYKSCHAFRRGNITFLINDLMVPERIVGARVGHESEGMTLGVYCQTSTGKDREWVDKIREVLYG